MKLMILVQRSWSSVISANRLAGHGRRRFGSPLAVLGLSLVASMAVFAADPLPSWNEGPAKQSIVEFVKATTQEGGAQFVSPTERIATFDQDGTLWVEQPLYSQLFYCLSRVPAAVQARPELAHVEPFKTVLAGDRAAMAKLTLDDFLKIAMVTLSGMPTDEFKQQVHEWLAKARDPRWKRPFTELTYQPMKEVMQYLRDNDKTYIVSGGGQDFVRVYAEDVYGVPPEQVVGSAGATEYGYDKSGKPELTKLPKMLLNDNDAGKPENIYLLVGRQPYAAFGNSTGDKQMLEYTNSGRS
ncbi:HAD family hydrolase [Pseudomonas sp. TH03]|uniref:HAD family hydrolase n=1 Tax=Pseudomonas sp. TH03 TaxID=2796369 RepID=UPI001F5B18F6|nr:HAD family hydrolase [Pseudomonas sp. TH03]